MASRLASYYFFFTALSSSGCSKIFRNTHKHTQKVGTVNVLTPACSLCARVGGTNLNKPYICVKLRLLSTVIRTKKKKGTDYSD